MRLAPPWSFVVAFFGLADCGTYVTCFRSGWRLHTAGARLAGRPGSLPPSGCSRVDQVKSSVRAGVGE
jgi:hypothetical protein